MLLHEQLALLAEHSPKTVNNVLATLSKLLRVAKRLKVIRGGAPSP